MDGRHKLGRVDASVSEPGFPQQCRKHGHRSSLEEDQLRRSESIKLDDLSFPAPIYATLAETSKYAFIESR
jgi:hypothetical protein